jgi:hypothetical protein
MKPGVRTMSASVASRKPAMSDRTQPLVVHLNLQLCSTARALGAPLVAAALLLALALPARQAVAADAQAVSADLRMAEDAAPMRRVADRFVARALAGDAASTSAMLSRALVERMGQPAAMKAMREQVLPFFARGGEIGRSVTVTRTTDAAGQTGFAFYLWLVRDQAERRPFTVYVVNEGGNPVVANVVPDRFVEGRHQ